MFMNERHSPYTSDLMNGIGIPPKKLGGERAFTQTRDGNGNIRLEQLAPTQQMKSESMQNKYRMYNNNHF